MSTVEEVLSKLAKLKEQAAAAPDFLALEKIATKADKIRAKLAEHRSNKQLNGILDKIQLLIQEKSKYFRQAMIKKSNKFIAEDNARNEEADRTLKYSKSAESLKIMTSKRGEVGRKQGLGPSRSALAANQQNQIMYSATKVNEMDQGNSAGSGEEAYSEVPPSSKANLKPFLGSQRNIKKKYEVEDVEKTIANTNSEEKRRMGGEINLLEQKLSFSFRQIEDLNKKIAMLEDFKEKSSREALQHVSPMAKNYMAKESSIVDEYSQKLREKGFIIEDLKSKVEYFKSMNEELKTKVINEQRRSEDYAEGLKSELKGLRKQIERLKKENQCSKIELEDLEQKNEGLMGQVKKLVAKLEEESKEKENIKRSMSQASSMKIQEQQKQIENLTSQVQILSRLQIKLQQEEEEKKKIEELKEKLQQRITELQTESRRFEEERNRLELEMYKLEEEKRWLGSELRVNMEAKEMLAEELLTTKERLDGQLQAESLKEYESELRARSKLGKLKELKGLISQIK